MQITIAHLSEANKNERLDSQFFRPEYVRSDKVLTSGSYSELCDIAHITDGNHLKIADNFDSADGIRYLRGQGSNKPSIKAEPSCRQFVDN